jgi:hypothetical protein
MAGEKEGFGALGWRKLVVTIGERYAALAPVDRLFRMRASAMRWQPSITVNVPPIRANSAVASLTVSLKP